MSCRVERTGLLGCLMLGLALIFCQAGMAVPSGPPAHRTQNLNTEPALPDNAWPKLSDEQQKQAVKELKGFAAEASRKIQRPLQEYDTDYFLFYSDLSSAESRKWVGLLDRMYANLTQTFGVKRKENIWRGKALVFVFSKEDDYRRYETQLMRTDGAFVEKTAGMCHSLDSGYVMIDFFRQPEELSFAHVLVHESVHGFIHRYRTPVRVPSWANEGLAETIATDLVPQKGHRDGVRARAREEIKGHGNSMGHMFDAEHIDDWQYPVAQNLCEFMITAGRKNYVDFIIGVKDGMEWRQALEKKFKVPLDRLAAVYGISLGVQGVTP